MLLWAFATKDFFHMPLISCLAVLGLIVGLFVERNTLASRAFNRILSKILVQLIYPCLIFSALLQRFHWQELEPLILLPFTIFFICAAGYVFGRLTVPRTGLSQNSTQRSYVFLAIMPNYSFVPLIIAQAIWGDKGVALVALSSVGADLFLWTFAYPVIAGKREWKKVFSPALLTILLALVLLSLDVDTKNGFFEPLLFVMGLIGKATLPLSMYVLGCQLARAGGKLSYPRAQKILLLWRLMLCPLLMLGMILSVGTALPYEAKAIALIIASMPGAIVTVVLAELHDADGLFAASQILYGHVLGLATVAMWQGLLYLAIR
jgi:predicted permease